MVEDFLGVVDKHEAQLFPELFGYVLDIALVSAGQDHLADAHAVHGQHLLLDPSHDPFGSSRVQTGANSDARELCGAW